MRPLLLAGILVGYLALSTQVALPKAPLEVAQAEQASEEKGNEAAIGVLEAITSTVQINLNQAFMLIEVLPTLPEAELDETSPAQSTTIANKVMQVILRKIHSPNAP